MAVRRPAVISLSFQLDIWRQFRLTRNLNARDEKPEVHNANIDCQNLITRFLLPAFYFR